MAIKGPPPPRLPPRAPKPSFKGKRAKAAPKSKYMRPQPTDTDEEERVAFERKHAADMEEEARRHTDVDNENELKSQEELEEEERRVKGLNWDERRKKKGRRRQDDEDDEDDGEAAAEAAKSAKEKGLVASDGAGKYFQDMPEDRMGDLSLTDPNEMKRLLGPTVRFAQHAMLLAQARMEDGVSRTEAIQYLASLYDGVGDREYARKALKEFGPATGILDVYPLEVVEHLLQHVPGFFTNVKHGRFLTSAPNSRYEATAGETIFLSYPPELKIRGFAIKGGQRPGYLLEPTEPKGTYALSFQSAGSFEVIISAISRGGGVLIEEMLCEIAEGDDAAFEAAAAIQRERAAAAETEEETKEKKKKEVEEDLRIHLKQRI